MSLRQQAQEQRIVESKHIKVERGFLRMCPVCAYLCFDDTLYDPEMLYRHLKGRTHTKEEIADALQDLSMGLTIYRQAL
jgi:hypothetical protein